MGKRGFALAAIGFVQTLGLAGSVNAQKVFQDQDCQIDTPLTCSDVSCQTPATPNRVCQNQQAMVPQGGAQVDGCFCFDPGQALPQCETQMDPSGASICLDFDCEQVDPALHCDENCQCVPDQPEVFDHYKCYKIKKGEKFKETIVDLEALQTEFGLESGCKVKKATKFCVPVKKTVTQVDPNVTLMSFPGQDLTQDMMCYQIKCEKLSIPAQTVEDQFGSRSVTLIKAFEVCTPAGKVP